MIRCVDVALSIPDNEALTALVTLQRLGVPVDALTRADLYRCDVEENAEDDLLATMRGSESIFNPNKHRIALRTGANPLAGEVWIDALDAHDGGEPLAGAALPAVRGRALRGIRRLERFTAWRLFDRDGAPVPTSVVTAAVETLLCNPAFQKATMT
jgi:hypothetical protein